MDPIDKIKAAYFYHVLGLTQAQITVVLNAANQGRVNEAIKDIEEAVGMPTAHTIDLFGKEKPQPSLAAASSP